MLKLTIQFSVKITELFALKQFMYKHDYKRMLEWAHQRFEETGAKQWKVSEKWRKYDPIYKAESELEHTSTLITK